MILYNSQQAVMGSPSKIINDKCISAVIIPFNSIYITNVYRCSHLLNL
ncbi:hypothetical protein HMPREF1567_0840 [Providencia alcalifaciens PAL-2]|nr:hypothetical protein HMPREF1562_0303 [Providencia alcalifaciens F90-2004]EUC94064.1 hypothetical protein HMPREF1567_0840 [Providencia alcalifaciens PAL-2]